jgi:hypothetical protein
MTRRTRNQMLAALGALTITLAACGSDDSDTAESAGPRRPRPHQSPRR